MTKFQRDLLAYAAWMRSECMEADPGITEARRLIWRIAEAMDRADVAESIAYDNTDGPQ